LAYKNIDPLSLSPKGERGKTPSPGKGRDGVEKIKRKFKID
jgi:hypothetical protein